MYIFIFMYNCHMCIHIYTYIHTPYIYIIVYMSDTSWVEYRDFSAPSYHGLSQKSLKRIYETQICNGFHAHIEQLPCPTFGASRMAAWHLTGGPARCCHGTTIGIQTSHCLLASVNCMGLYNYIYHVRYPGIFLCTVWKTYRMNPKIVVAEYGFSHFILNF